jgi:DNA-binding MarR family transcriptional regulator
MTTADASPAPLISKSESVTISYLLSYQLSRISNSLSRSAALHYRREFDLSLGEWRVVALIGESGSLTHNRLARRSALDKAQMSRVVKGLVTRGLILRTNGAGRTTSLSLTDAGIVVYDGLMAVSNERDQRIRRHLGVRDQASLARALETLTTLVRVMEEEEILLGPE